MGRWGSGCNFLRYIQNISNPLEPENKWTQYAGWKTYAAWQRKTPRLLSQCGGSVAHTHKPTPSESTGVISWQDHIGCVLINDIEWIWNHNKSHVNHSNSTWFILISYTRKWVWRKLQWSIPWSQWLLSPSCTWWGIARRNRQRAVCHC